MLSVGRHSMKSVSELEAELDELDRDEAALGARLEAELADMGGLRERLACVRGCVAELDGARARAEALGVRVGATASKAQRMSAKLRALDLAQGRVQATLSVVVAASQLARSAALVAAAMDEGRYEEAAAHIASVLDRLGDDGGGAAVAAGAAAADGGRARAESDERERDSALLAQILAARDALRARALAESAVPPAGPAGAAVAGDGAPEAGALRFVRLLPLLGEPAEAFRRLAALRRAALRADVGAARARAEEAARGDDARVPWAELVARALQGTAAAIEADAHFVLARLGGPRGLVRYVVELHSECRSLAASLAGALVRARQLRARVAALRQAEPGGAGLGGGSAGAADVARASEAERASLAAEVDGCADELCHVLNGGGSYDAYALQRLEGAGEVGEADGEASLAALVLLCAPPAAGGAGGGTAEAPPAGGGFALASSFAADAIGAGLAHAMHRALRMGTAGAARAGASSAEPPSACGARADGREAPPLATSAPDDAFYLAKRAVQRAAHTQSLWVLASVTRAAAQLLRAPYLEALRGRAKGGGNGLGLGLLAAALGGGGGGTGGGGDAGAGQRLGAIGSKLSAAAYGATATLVSAGGGGGVVGGCGGGSCGGSECGAEQLAFLANLNDLATSLEYLRRLEDQQVRAQRRAALRARHPRRALARQPVPAVRAACPPVRYRRVPA